MSELLFESPITLGVTGLAFTLIALVTWIKGGFRAALYAAIALAVLTVVLLVVNLRVKTDREQIEQLLHDVAAAVERNDLPAVVSYIHPGAVQGLQRAKSEMPKYQFTSARITGIKSIQVHRDTHPPSAIAEFHVAVSLGTQGNHFDGIRRFVRAYFMERDGRWLVHNYEHFDVSAGFRNTPLSGG
jgi:ketosteroid isomerase-like protein